MAKCCRPAAVGFAGRIKSSLFSSTSGESFHKVFGCFSIKKRAERKCSAKKTSWTFPLTMASYTQPAEQNSNFIKLNFFHLIHPE